MKPTRITELFVQNAMTFKKLRVNLDNQGLVHVRGINHDAAADGGDSSNGAAKSAIFEVLRHILLGSTARGIKGKELVRAGSKGGYFGMLSIEKDDDIYSVQQSVAHKQYGSSTVLYRGEEMISHQRAKLRTQKQVAEEILGMTPQQVDSRVIISQEASHPLVNGSGAECAAYISESFGLDVYDEMKEKLKAATKQTDQQLGESKAYESILAAAEKKLSELEVDGLDAKIKKKEAKAAEEQELAEKAQTKLLEYRKVLQDIQEHERLTAQLGEYVGQRRDDLIEKAALYRKKAEHINEKLAAHKAAARQREILEKAEARYAALNEWIVKYGDAFEVAGGVIRANNDQIKELEERAEHLLKLTAPLDRLEDLSGSAECPTCGQPLDAAHMKEELEKARRAEKKHGAVRREINDLREENKKHVVLIEEFNTQVLRRKEMTKQISDMLYAEPPPIDVPEREARRTQLNGLIRELDDAVATMDRIKRLPKVQNIDQGATKASIQTLEQTLGESQAAAREINQQLGELRGQKREIKTLQEQIERSKQEIDRLAKFKRENELRKTLIKALGRLKVRRSHGIIQAIQTTLPPYVQTMFGDEDVAVEVDDQNPESIERWCSRPHPTEPGERVRIPLRAMSKGERARLRVAFIWAVRKLMRSERNVNILVLDEADGGLDRQGLEAYGSLLEQLREEYASIFVISHRKELSTIRFDRTWTVEKKGGISRLTVES